MAILGSKPMRQCRGCALNLGATCAIFHHPPLKWKDGQCEGYNNAFYIRHYETTLKADASHAIARDAAGAKPRAQTPQKAAPRTARAKAKKAPVLRTGAKKK